MEEAMAYWQSSKVAAKLNVGGVSVVVLLKQPLPLGDALLAKAMLIVNERTWGTLFVNRAGSSHVFRGYRLEPDLSMHEFGPLELRVNGDDAESIVAGLLVEARSVVESHDLIESHAARYKAPLRLPGR